MDKREREIRAYMAEHGVKRAQAVRELDTAAGRRPGQDKTTSEGVTVWALLSLTGDQAVDAVGADADPIAYGAAYVPWREPAPQVTLYPQPLAEDHHALHILLRLAYQQSQPPTTPEQLAEHIGHELKIRRGHAWTARVRVVDDGERAELLETAVCEHPGPQVATQRWHRHAIVQFADDYTTHGPYTDPVHWRRGRLTRLYQSGRAGEPVDRSQWHTNFDIDLMQFIPDDVVRVVELLADVPPCPTGSEPSTAHWIVRRWRRAHAWAQQAFADPAADGEEVEALLEDRAQATRDLSGAVVSALPSPEWMSDRTPDPDPHDQRLLLEASLTALEQIALALDYWPEQSPERDGVRRTATRIRAALEQTDADPAEICALLAHLHRTGAERGSLSAAVLADAFTAQRMTTARTGVRHPGQPDPDSPARRRIAERVADLQPIPQP